MKIDHRDLIVTGIPRAGTTLLAACVDSLEDAVCLSEPEWQALWSQETKDRLEYIARLSEDFDRVRHILQDGASVPDRRRDDQAPVTDYYRQPGAAGAKYEVQQLNRVGLSKDFLLGMKHNAHYTCVLDELLDEDRFHVLAIIRHPVATIQSWRSLPIPIREGRLPAAERFWPEIAALWQDTNDLLEVQVRIYGLFCQRFWENSGRLTVIRYEDLLSDHGLVEKLFDRKYVRDILIDGTRQCDAENLEESSQIRKLVQTHCPVVREYYPDMQ